MCRVCKNEDECVEYARQCKACILTPILILNNEDYLIWDGKPLKYPDLTYHTWLNPCRQALKYRTAKFTQGGFTGDLMNEMVRIKLKDVVYFIMNSLLMACDK